MTGFHCEKYIVYNVQRLIVPSIGKIPQLNRTNSPKCIGNRSSSGMHTYIPAKRRYKRLCLGEGCTILIDRNCKAQLFRAVFDYFTNICPNIKTPVMLGVVSTESPLLVFIFFNPPAAGGW